MNNTKEGVLLMRRKGRKHCLTVGLLTFLMAWVLIPLMGGRNQVEAETMEYTIILDATEAGYFDPGGPCYFTTKVQAGHAIRDCSPEYDYFYEFYYWLDEDGNEYTPDELCNYIPTKDMRFYVESKIVQLTFDPNGGSVRRSYPGTEYIYRDKFSFAHATSYHFWMTDLMVVRGGYTFVGWESISGWDVGKILRCGDFNYKYNARTDTEYRAVWRKNEEGDDPAYTLTFDANGGSICGIDGVESGYSIDVLGSIGYWTPNAVKSDKAFLGWKQVDGSGAGTVFYDSERIYPVDNMTLVAIWKDEPEPEVLNGWKKVDGGRAYYQNGIRVTGVKKIDGKTYYFKPDGIMFTGLKTFKGKTYYFGSNGAMKTGWVTGGGKKYYFDSKGAMVTGAAKIEGKIYYFNTKGVLQTGWLTIGKKSYYLDPETGAMVTGAKKIDGKVYYFSSKGVMHKGWLELKNRKYYFDTDGTMVTGTKTIDGITYVFAKNGVLISVDEHQ